MSERHKPPNHLLRQARRRLPSPSGSGRPMSRQEEADAVNAYLAGKDDEPYQREATLDANHIGKLERGEHRWPNDIRREAFRHVLGVGTDAELGFYITRGLRSSAAQALEVFTPQATVAAHPIEIDNGIRDGRASLDLPGQEGCEQREDPATNRRDAAKLITMLLAVASPPAIDVLMRLADRRSRRSLDTRDLAGHVELADALGGMYRSADPRLMLPMACAYADSLLEIVDDLSPGAVDVAPVVVGVHAQVGLWACHADRPSLAYRYLALACEVAASTDDPALHARAMGALSYLHSSAPRGGHGGNPGRALALLDAALAKATNADPFTRGWLATWRADQHATLGHLAQARADVDLAAAALDRGDNGRLVGFFSRRNYGYGMRGHLDSVRATAYAMAGEADDADRAFAQVHSSAANMRRRVATYGHQALAHTANTQPEAACAALTRSVDLAVREHYAMGLRRAHGVRARFNPAWSRLPCVRQLDEHLAAVPATAA